MVPEAVALYVLAHQDDELGCIAQMRRDVAAGRRVIVAFLTDEAVYRFMYRVDGQLNWNAALTPKSGGSPLSPVVTLT